MRVKINIYKILLILILLFIPINLLKDLFPIPLTLMTGGLILVLMCALIFKNMTRKQSLIMMIPVILFFMGFIVTDDVSRHVRYFFNWYALLCTLMICSDKNKISSFLVEYKNNSRLLHNLLRVVALVIAVLLMLPSAYSGGWWGLSNGFVAFTVSHAVAASMCAFVVFEFMYLQDKSNIKNQIEGGFFLLLAVYAVFQTGARTYVISIMAICMIYVFDVIKSRNVRISVIVLGIIFIGVIISNSAFMEKNSIVSSYQQNNGVSFVNAMSSGRTMIWFVDFLGYIKSNIYIILFGKGFAFSYELNRLYYYGFDIFSHNIFLETMLSLGLCGLIILVYVMSNVIKKCKYSFIDTSVIFIYMIFVGFLNGLFDSQIYCYSILLVVLAIVNKHQNSRTEALVLK